MVIPGLSSQSKIKDMTIEQEKKFKLNLEGIIGDAGKVLDIADHDSDGGWIVILDTEYAALKVYYKFRTASYLNFGKSCSVDGWYVSVRG